VDAAADDDGATESDADELALEASEAAGVDAATAAVVADGVGVASFLLDVHPAIKSRATVAAAAPPTDLRTDLIVTPCLRGARGADPWCVRRAGNAAEAVVNYAPKSDIRALD
jgi:hypothetical protein